MFPQGRARTGYLMVLGGAALFAVNGTVSKVLLSAGISAGQLTEIRSAGAFLGLLAVLALLAPGRLRVRRRELPFLLLYGVVGCALVQWFYFLAIERLPVGVALLFEYTAPVLVALWARFGRREPVRSRVWAALALALIGLALVSDVGSGSALSGAGIAAGLAAATALAIYFLLGERGLRERDALSMTCYAFGFATLFWSLLQPWWRFPFSRLGEQTALLGTLSEFAVPVWTLVIWLVVLGTIVPFVLVLGSMRHLPVTRVGILGMAEPVGASLVAYLWLAEALGPAQLLGGAVVLVGVVLAQTAR